MTRKQEAQMLERALAYSTTLMKELEGTKENDDSQKWESCKTGSYKVYDPYKREWVTK